LAKDRRERALRRALTPLWRLPLTDEERAWSHALFVRRSTNDPEEIAYYVVFAPLECELIERESFDTKSEACLSVFEFVDGWYNPDRLHSRLGYQSPQRYEEEYHSQEYSQSKEPHSPVAA
jgi:hypothetical protein